MRRLRQIAPSKGPKRYRFRKLHKPSDVLKRKSRSLDVVRLFDVLREREWVFAFKVEATSPRGFKYIAEGATPEEAFLRAFGQWRNDFSQFIPEIPRVLSELAKAKVAAAPPTPVPEPPAKRNWNSTGLADIARRYGERAYQRAYMRHYRKKNDSPSDPRLVAA